MMPEMSQEVFGSSKISRWGNSLGLRIPKAVTESGKLKEGDQVEFLPDREGFCIRKRREYSLSDLVAGITENNRHAETPWGKPTGNEAW